MLASSLLRASDLCGWGGSFDVLLITFPMEKSPAKKKKEKVSKKELRSLLHHSVEMSLVTLHLPEPNKKVRKIISRSTKKMASAFAQLLKKELKRSKPKKAKVEPSDVAQVA